MQKTNVSLDWMTRAAVLTCNRRASTFGFDNGHAKMSETRRPGCVLMGCLALDSGLRDTARGPRSIRMKIHIPRFATLTVAIILLTMAGAQALAQSSGASLTGTQQETMAQSTEWTDISPSWLQSTSPCQITFQPGTPGRILLGTCTEGLCFSSDHGATWSREYSDFFIDVGIPSWWIRDVIFNPGNPQEALAVTMSGSYWSDNGGHSWLRHQGSMMPTSAHMLTNSPDGTYAFASEYFGSLFRYDWNAMAWDNELVVHYGMGLYGISFDRSSPARLYMGSEFYDAAVSIDMGQSFFSFSEGLPGPAIPMVADPEVPDRVLAASGSNIYVKPELKSRRPVWFLHSSGLPGTTVLSLIHDPRDPNRMFAGTVDEGVHYSLDRGATWQPLTRKGLDHLSVVDLAINPEKPGWLLAAGHSGGPASGGLFKIRLLRP